ncbi:YwiC-like family protein [Propionibacteriaceae bacterium G1746]
MLHSASVTVSKSSEMAALVLGPAWVCGYLAFNALNLWTKSPPSRRAAYRHPLLVYGLATVVLGGVAVGYGGPGVLWWAPLGAVLIGAALLATRHKQERSLAAGLVSVAAGTGVGVVTRFWSPADLGSATSTDIATLVATAAYFAGTVLVVKTMIRQRGHTGWLLGSIGYHVLLLAGVVVAAASGWLGWPWVLFAALCLVRAVVEPVVARRRPLSPLQVGVVEIVLSVVLLVVAWAG